MKDLLQYISTVHNTKRTGKVNKMKKPFFFFVVSAHSCPCSTKIQINNINFPSGKKCGTTWTQELTWLILNEARVEECAKASLIGRSPFLDFPMILKLSDEKVNEFFDELELRPSRRIIKSHLPFELLPDGLENKCKVIFVSRNVKDVVVSYFHFQILLRFVSLTCDFVTFARDLYKPNLTFCAGYFEMLESGWQRRTSPNLLFLWYEEMKKEGQIKIIHRIADHIGAQVTDEEVQKIDEFVQFENFKKKSSMNQKSAMWNDGKGEFVRKGKVGDWVNLFTPELTAEYDAWIREELARLNITDPEIVSYFQLAD
jgi:hypothetical protein